MSNMSYKQREEVLIALLRGEAVEYKNSDGSWSFFYGDVPDMDIFEFRVARTIKEYQLHSGCTEEDVDPTTKINPFGIRFFNNQGKIHIVEIGPYVTIALENQPIDVFKSQEVTSWGEAQSIWINLNKKSPDKEYYVTATTTNYYGQTQAFYNDYANKGRKYRAFVPMGDALLISEQTMSKQTLALLELPKRNAKIGDRSIGQTVHINTTDGTTSHAFTVFWKA